MNVSIPLPSLSLESRKMQPHPGHSCGHRQLQPSLPSQGSPHSSHLFQERNPTYLTLLPTPSSVPSSNSPQNQEPQRKKTGQGNFFSSPNSKIYFNCRNTVDYKQLLYLTEHVQVASWNGCCQCQCQGWGVPCHSQERATRAGAVGEGTSCSWLRGSGAAEHMNSWALTSLWHICIQKWELNQFSLPSAGRPGVIHAISY